MSGRLKDLQNKLLHEVGGAISEYGFSPKPVGQDFYQKRPFGRASLHLSFIPHDQTDFDVTGDVALRVDAVENLINEDRALSKSVKVRTATVGAELGNIERGKFIRYNVADEWDITPAVDGLVSSLVRAGLPYIERCSNLERMLELLASNDSSSWLYSPFPAARCERAIALAFVLGKYERLDLLIEQCESFLRAKNDPGGVRRFQELAAKLRSMHESRI
jgi:hypothetical protein